MGVEHIAQIESEDVVGAHRDHDVRGELGEEVALLDKGVCVPRGDGLVSVAALKRRQDPQPPVGPVEVPWPSVGEVVVERVGLVLLDDPDILQATVGDLRQGDVDEAVGPSEGQ